jgi:hypothetical protein
MEPLGLGFGHRMAGGGLSALKGPPGVGGTLLEGVGAAV